MNQKHRWIALGLFALILLIGATVVFWPDGKPKPLPRQAPPDAPAMAQPPSAGFDSATLLSATPQADAAPFLHEPLPPHVEEAQPVTVHEGPPISFMPERFELGESGWDEPVTRRDDGILTRLPDWSAAAEWLAPSKPIAAEAETPPTPVIDTPIVAAPLEQETATDIVPEISHPTYIVKPSDTLWTISQRTYGTGAFFVALSEHNRGVIDQPKELEIGQSIETPPALWLLKQYPKLCPPPSKAIAASTVVTPSGSGQPDYIVREGDTLEAISVISLGRSDRWREILALNQDQLGASGGYLKPGMILDLPPDARAATTVLRPMDAPR